MFYGSMQQVCVCVYMYKYLLTYLHAALGSSLIT